MRNLGLTLVQCRGGIQDNVRRAGPQLANCRVVSLISKRDVNILQAYHESRVQNERQPSRKCVGFGDSAFFKVERCLSRGTSSKSLALSYEIGLDQSSPVANLPISPLSISCKLVRPPPRAPWFTKPRLGRAARAQMRAATLTSNQRTKTPPTRPVLTNRVARTTLSKMTSLWC